MVVSILLTQSATYEIRTIITNSYKFLHILTNAYKFLQILQSCFSSSTRQHHLEVCVLDTPPRRPRTHSWTSWFQSQFEVTLSLDWEQKQHSAEPQVTHPQFETPTWYSWRPDEGEVLSVWSFQTLTGKWQRWDTLYPWIYFVAQQERYKKMTMTIPVRCWRALQSFQEGSNL